VSLDVHLIEIRNQKLNVKQTFAQRPPRETQAVCDLRKTPNASTQHEIKF
jgi:branched-chain amino acid transport system substrate-binding protein